MKAGRISIDLTAGTAQFILDMDRAGAKLKDFGSNVEGQRSRLRGIGSEAGNTGRSFQELGSHGVTGVQATSAALRVLEGNMTNNLRAAERFLANTLGLGSVLKTVFPIAGGIAFLGILGELGKKAFELYEAFEKMREAPQRIAQELRQLNAPLQQQNDELDLANAKLENEIAKLSGRPQNGLKEALAEARLEADKLADSLDKDFRELNKLLSENAVGFWKSLLGNARTDDLVKEFGGGSSGFLASGFPGRVQKITDQAEEELAAIQPGTTKEEQKAANAQKNAVNAHTRNALEKEFSEELKKVNVRLEEARRLETLRNAQPRPTPPQSVKRNADGIPIPTTAPTNNLAPGPLNGGAIAPPSAAIRDQAQLIQQLEGIRHRLILEQHQITSRYENEALTEQVTGLRQQNDAAALTRPYSDKIHELDAQLVGLKQQLASIGQSSTAETLAKSWSEAQQSISKLNDELARHHQSLTLDQQIEILTRTDEIASIKAEEEWQSKLEQTTTSIQDRIQSLKLLTSAIGEGYEAQKKATVQEQLFQAFGKDKDKLGDQDWLNQKDSVTGETHRQQVETLRTRLNVAYDVQQNENISQTLDKLGHQIEAENSLARAESLGVAATRDITLAYRLREIAETEGLPKTRALIQAEIDLAAAQTRRVNLAALGQGIANVTETATTPEQTERQRQARAHISSEIAAARTSESDAVQKSIAELNEETAATERLTLAQLSGAEAVRKAQLENRIEQIKRATPADLLNPQTGRSLRQEQIEAVTRQSEVEHHHQVIREALQSGLSYQNRLESIDEQVAALRQIQSTQGDTLATEISLRELEKERAKVRTEQVTVLGSARDGLKAFFQEMATQGVSAAEEVHEALKSTFDSLNDNLAKLAANQKVSWASLFQSISADLTKASLRNIEAQISGKLFPHVGAVGTAQPPRRPWDEHIELHPVAAGKASQPGAGSRDGQSAGTAWFVTTTEASAAANPAPSTSAAPASANAPAKWDRLFSAGAGLLRTFGGFRASGGGVSNNKSYVIGEKGPELFVPGAPGVILPADQLKQLVSGFTETWDVTALPKMAKRYFWDIPGEEGRHATEASRSGHYGAAAAHLFAGMPSSGFAGDIALGAMALGKRASQEWHRSRYLAAAADELAGSVPLVGPAAVSISDKLVSNKPGRSLEGGANLLGMLASGGLPFVGIPKAALAIADFAGSRLVPKLEGGQFYSPNEAENLTFEEAEAALNSAEQARLLKRSEKIDRDLGLRGKQRSGIGVWTDGAENSIWNVTRNPSWEAQRYSTALKGDIARQKGAIHYVVDPKGPDRLYRVELPNATRKELSASLHEHGLPLHTVFAKGHGAEAVVIDFGSTLGEKVNAFAKRHHVRVTARRVQAEFLGAETREGAHNVYEQVFSEHGRGELDRGRYGTGTGNGRPDYWSNGTRLVPEEIVPAASGIATLSGAAQDKASKDLEFGGFRATGGPVKADKLHVVGEKGPELFVPETDGTIVPNHKLSSFASLLSSQGGSTQRGMAHSFGGFRQEGGDVEAGKLHIVGEKGMELFIPLASMLTLGATDWQHLDGIGGNRFVPQLAKGLAPTPGNMHVLSQSLPNATPGFMEVLAGSFGGGAIAASGRSRGIGPAPAPPKVADGASGAAAADPLANPNLWPKLPTPPPSLKYGLRSAGPMLAQLGIGVGLGLLARLFNRPKDHHFQPGHPYTLPSWNDSAGMSFGGYRALGGGVDPGYSYVVGERGPELFTPASAGAIMPSHVLSQHQQGVTYYVDARGSDPAAVEQRIRQANIETGKSTSQTTFRAWQEYQQRTPQKTK